MHKPIVILLPVCYNGTAKQNQIVVLNCSVYFYLHGKNTGSALHAIVEHMKVLFGDNRSCVFRAQLPAAHFFFFTENTIRRTYKLKQMCKRVLSLILVVILSLPLFTINNLGWKVYSASSNWAWPTSITNLSNISAGWPLYPSGGYHGGIDFPVASGSPVYSTCDGEVVDIQSWTTSYGKHIKVKAIVNGETVYIRYCHLSGFATSVGAKVSAGQLIAYSGSTGNVTGPHLHYEVRNANDYQGDPSSPNLNPTYYLPGTSYTFQENNPSRIIFWTITNPDNSDAGIDQNTTPTLCGSYKFWFKKNDGDSNHYILFKLDGHAVDGDIHHQADSSGNVSITLNTNDYAEGQHSIQAILVNTSGTYYSDEKTFIIESRSDPIINCVYWGNSGVDTQIRPVVEIANPETVSGVSFPMWSHNGDGAQNNLNWYGSVFNGGLCWFNDIEYNNFSYPNIECHCYVYGKNGSTQCIALPRSYNKNYIYSLDVNMIIDGERHNSGASGFSFDMYFDGKLEGNDATDWCHQHYYGSSFEIQDIKCPSGYVYTGATVNGQTVSGSTVTGTVNIDTDVTLNFSSIYKLDVNVYIDGEENKNGCDGFTFDVYLNNSNSPIKNDVIDYCNYSAERGTVFSINDIRYPSGHVYTGATVNGQTVSGSTVTGTVTKATEVKLYFSTNKHTLDVNVYVDGVEYRQGYDGFTFDVSTNGYLTNGNVKDYCVDNLKYGSPFKIDDIQYPSGYAYTGGVVDGQTFSGSSVTGTLTKNTEVKLYFSSLHKFDINVVVDGVEYRQGLEGYTFDVYLVGYTFDVYLEDRLLGNDVIDYCDEYARYGAEYFINDIQCPTGYSYSYSGIRSVVSGYTPVTLYFGKTQYNLTFDVNYDDIHPNLFISPESPRTINGIEYSFDPETNGITFNGTATSIVREVSLTTVVFQPRDNTPLTVTVTQLSGTMYNGYFKFVPSGSRSGTIAWHPDGSNNNQSSSFSFIPSGPNDNNSYSPLSIQIMLCNSGSGSTTSLRCNNLKLRIKIERGDSSAFSPYRTKMIAGSQYYSLPDLTRTGYTFDGWYTDPTGGEKITESSAYPADNQTLYAHWTRTYTAEIAHWCYGLNGKGTNTNIDGNAIRLATTTKTYTYASGVSFTEDDCLSASALPNGVMVSSNRFGSSAFSDGWSSYSFPQTFDNVDKDVIVQIDYRLIDYSIAYDLDSGTLADANPSAYNVVFGASFVNESTRPGYTFAGWTINGTDIVTGINETPLDDSVFANDQGLAGGSFFEAVKDRSSGDVTVKALWTPVPYSVRYNGNGATSGSMSDQTFTYDTAQALTANAYRRAYTLTYNYNGATGGNADAIATATATFNGWATSTGGAKVYDDGQSVQNLAESGTVKLYANWTLHSVTLPTPTKAGYSFDGWFTDESLTTSAGAAGASFTPTTNVTLYAKWTALTVTGLTVKTLPGKTTYTVGDTLDTTGLTLTAAMSDGTSEMVTSGFACTPTTLDTAGTQTITVTYGGQTATFTVTVTEPVPTDTPQMILSAPTAKAGDRVDVTLSIANNPGIVATSVNLTYDNTVLRLVSVKDGGLLGANFSPGRDLTAVPYTVLWEDGLAVQNHTEDGVLATFTFEVLEDAPIGKTPITLNYIKKSTINVDLQEVEFAMTSGSIEVIDRTPGDVNKDGSIDLKDVVMLRRYLSGGWNVTIDEANADVNADNSIDLKDTALISRYLAGGWNVTLL